MIAKSVSAHLCFFSFLNLKFIFQEQYSGLHLSHVCFHLSLKLKIFPGQILDHQLRNQKKTLFKKCNLRSLSNFCCPVKTVQWGSKLLTRRVSNLLGRMVKNIWSCGFYLFSRPVLVQWACLCCKGQFEPVQWSQFVQY